MFEAFIGAFFGAAIGVVGGVYLTLIAAKKAAKITETKVIDGHVVMFVYDD